MSARFFNHSAPASSLPAGVRPVLQSVHAVGTVHGLLFEMCVTQTYRNPGRANLEAVYSFPLPVDAVLLGMECTLGERTLHGRVLARRDAQEQYEAALDAGDTAVMLERAADGVYSANLGNLLANETAVVRLRYALLLSFHQGQVRITVPSVIAPRFGAPAAAALQPHQVPTHDLRAAYPWSLSLQLHGPLARGRISSPSHALAIRNVNGQVDVDLAQPDVAMLDRDFVLIASGLAGEAIATVSRDGAGYVALASFCPVPEAAEPDLPLHLKVLVDCSGSMNGDSIAGARAALHRVLAELTPADRFTYSRFGSTVAHHSVAFMAATPQAVRTANGWIAQTAADLGGTELHAALLSTYSLGAAEAADILLVTDGDVWDTDPLVAGAVKSGQRIFAVGVGAAPAASLLQRLARGTGGACELVGANDDVQAAVLRMFRRMRQAPVNQVTVAWGDAAAWQSPPDQVVFSDETVHAAAGFSDSVPASAVMAWRDSVGTTREQRMALDGAIADGDTLARVAAAHRLGGLPASERQALALRYALVTDSTSLLLVHARADDDRVATMPVLHVVPQMMVAGRAGMGHISGLRQPAVFRRGDSSAVLDAMLRSGVEEYDIPSFLRASAGTGRAPQGVLRRLYAALLAWFLQGGIVMHCWRRIARRRAAPAPVDIPAFLRKQAD